jgi:hypothetical protein
MIRERAELMRLVRCSVAPTSTSKTDAISIAVHSPTTLLFPLRSSRTFGGNADTAWSPSARTGKLNHHDRPPVVRGSPDLALRRLKISCRAPTSGDLRSTRWLGHETGHNAGRPAITQPPSPKSPSSSSRLVCVALAGAHIGHTALRLRFRHSLRH